VSNATGQEIPPLIFMGVSGAGKTTVGSHVAATLSGTYLDADDYHPPANKERMRQGIPLTDDDRLPWLEAVGRAAAEALDQGALPVVGCSSLKRAHRDILRRFVPDAVFVHLAGRPEIIRDRMAGRAHEFMPDSLLDSQFAELEQPADTENHIHVEISSVDMDVAGVVIDMLAERWASAPHRKG